MECSVTVAGHRMVGDEEFCRQVFLVACSIARQGGPFAVSEDRMVFLSGASEIVLDVPGGFVEETDYEGAYSQLLKPKRARARVF